MSAARRMPVPIGVLALLILMLLLLGAGCERRSQDAPPDDAPSARIVATADFGRESLLDARVAPDQSVMRALRATTTVRTLYAGGFVSEMLGRRSDPTGAGDWFLFVNGILSPVGGKQVELAADDEVWWDFRRWGGLSDTWATVGQWPRPFTRPAHTVHADAPLDAALADAGARLTDDASAAWRVRVGASDALAARDAAWRRALDDPAAAGLTVTARDGRIEAFDAATRRWYPVEGARALIAAVPTGTYPDEGVLLAVAGLDAAAARTAADRLAADPELVRRAYAVAVDGDGALLQAGGRGRP